MAVTADKYELPLAVTDSVKEMARLFEMSENAVSSRIAKERSGRNDGYRFIRVEVEE